MENYKCSICERYGENIGCNSVKKGAKEQVIPPMTKFCPLCASKTRYESLLLSNDTYITQTPVCKKCKRAFFITYSEPITEGDILYGQERVNERKNSGNKDG